MLKVVETEESLADLAGIWEFIALENPISADVVSADRVLKAITDTYEMLSEFPNRTKIDGTKFYRVTIKKFSMSVP